MPIMVFSKTLTARLNFAIFIYHFFLLAATINKRFKLPINRNLQVLFCFQNFCRHFNFSYHVLSLGRYLAYFKR